MDVISDSDRLHQRRRHEQRTAKGPATPDPYWRSRGGPAMPATLKDEMAKIHADYDTAVAPLRMRLDNLSHPDGRDPKWLAAQRAEVLADYSRVHGQFQAAVSDWLTYTQKAVEQARATVTTDPAKRLADAQEVDSLARPMTSGEMAANRLLPEARRLLDIGALDRAAIYLRAAEAAGASVQARGIRTGLEAALDDTVPERAEARNMLIEAQTLAESFAVDLGVTASQFGGLAPDGTASVTGSAGDRVRASISAKLNAASLASESKPYADPMPKPSEP